MNILNVTTDIPIVTCYRNIVTYRAGSGQRNLSKQLYYRHTLCNNYKHNASCLVITALLKRGTVFSIWSE
jgi:hypothetical protein